MKLTGWRWRGVVGLWWGLLVAASAVAGVQHHPHIAVELVPEAVAVAPGESLTVALRLLPESGWHTYWRNPGDSGLETRIAWQLPEGVTVGPVVWPTPQRHPFGPLVNYGFEGETWLLSELQLPTTLKVGESLELAARAEWLVCEVECIPGEADFSLHLPIVAKTQWDTARREAWRAARAALPEAVAWPAQFAIEGRELVVQWQAEEVVAEHPEEAYFFPDADDLIDHAAPPQVVHRAGEWQLRYPLSSLFQRPPEAVTGVAVIAGRGYQLTALAGGEWQAAPPSDPPKQVLALWWILLLALAGGVLLNLMPCVFPVLSLKALSLAQGTAKARRERALHGLTYTLGVVASFALVAALLLALRAGGAAIGWGFQLQSPLFVGLLAMLLFALALSLSGVVAFGTQLMGLGDRLTSSGGYRGSFFTGVLATVVASPCTAPFMGTALGAAVLLPPGVAMLIFITLGLGMALPFLLLGLSPALARRLPRPGPWMETFKQAMAFPLYLTVVWLLWVLGRQSGVDALALVAVGLVLLALALWLWGRPPGRHPHWRNGSALLLLLLALATLYLPATLPPSGVSATGEKPHSSGYRPYRAETLAELRAAGETVLVNMTADWCITCLANERVALESEAVRSALAAQGVVYLKGDWTRRDAAITDYLASYGRNGVPLYVVYHPGQEGQMLPQILTPALVLSALQPTFSQPDL